MTMPSSVRSIVREFCEEADLPRLMASKKRADFLVKRAIWHRVRDTVIMANGLPPSYPQMGGWFGAHHTTIMDGVKGVEAMNGPKKIVKPLTPDDLEIAVKMRMTGKSYVEIGRELRRDSAAVSMSLREAGHASMLAAWTDAMDAVVRSMWDDGARCLDIAEKIGNGLTASAVSNRITRLGLQGRKRGRYRKSDGNRKRQATPRNVFPRENGSWDSRTFLPWPLWREWKKEQRRMGNVEV